MNEETVQNPSDEDNVGGAPDGNLLPDDPKKHHWGLRTQFGTGQAQPSSESKKKGWAKRRRNQELARTLLGLKFIGQDSTRMGKLFRDKLRTYFGMSAEQIEELDLESAVLLRLIGSAIEDGDNDAAREIMDRAYGKSTQFVDLKSDDEDRPVLNVQVINVLPNNDKMPDIKTDENEII